MTGRAGHRAALERMERARALTVHQIEEISRQITSAAELQAAQAAPSQRRGGRAGDWSPIRDPAYWAALVLIVGTRGNELRALWRRRDRQDAALRVYRRKHRSPRPAPFAMPFPEYRP